MTDEKSSRISITGIFDKNLSCGYFPSRENYTNIGNLSVFHRLSIYATQVNGMNDNFMAGHPTVFLIHNYVNNGRHN